MKIIALILIILYIQSCMQPAINPPATTAVQHEDSIKQWILNYLDEIWNQGNFSRAEYYWGPEFVNVFSPESGKGPEAMKQQVAYFLKAFESIHFELKDIIIRENKIAAWVVITGKHTGDLFGIKATQKEVKFREAVWYTLKDGKLNEVYPFVDWNDLFRQLGTYPELNSK